MLISKAQFIYYVEKYKKAHEKQEQLHNAIQPFFDFPIYKYRDDLVAAYESMLVTVSECEEEDNIFSWWLSESSADNKIITVEHQPAGYIVEYNVETAAGLYDYLYDMYHTDDW